MKVVADENIPCVKEAFQRFGDVHLVSGRSLTAEHVADASILLVRSVTAVGPALLENSSVKFVGTATIGVDHVDVAWLKEQGIGFTAAPGSNADSVAEYVMSSILTLARRVGFDYRKKILGIIGVGNVGSRVHKLASALGMKCILNDPPVQRMTGAQVFESLDTVLKTADILTVHVPLIETGEDATRNLISEERLGIMKRDTILINTSRGVVVDEDAVLRSRSWMGGLVMDVWHNEPAININVLDACDIATPHIAGYSYDGKIRGTAMLYDSACAYFFEKPQWSTTVDKKPVDLPCIDVRGMDDPVSDAILSAYPVEMDDKALREIAVVPENQRGAFFDNLRKNYPVRREFNRRVVAVSTTDAADLLTKCRFQIVGKDEN